VVVVGRVACVAEDILMRLTFGSIALPTCYVDRHTDIARCGCCLSLLLRPPGVTREVLKLHFPYASIGAKI